MKKKELTPELERVITIAKELWWLDRSPKSEAERLLSAALAVAFPDTVHVQETCSCGEPCDECQSQAYVDAEILRMEIYMERRAEIIAAAESIQADLELPVPP